MLSEPEAVPRPLARAVRYGLAPRKPDPRSDAKPGTRSIARRVRRDFIHPPTALALGVAGRAVADEQDSPSNSVLRHLPPEPRIVRTSVHALDLGASHSQPRVSDQMPRDDARRIASTLAGRAPVRSDPDHEERRHQRRDQPRRHELHVSRTTSPSPASRSYAARWLTAGGCPASLTGLRGRPPRDQSRGSCESTASRYARKRLPMSSSSGVEPTSETE